MLLRASESEIERERNVYNSTSAILFLGTPHRGGNFLAYGEMARRVVSAIGIDTNKNIMHDLSIDSHVLEDLHERFLRLYRRKKIEILTFQETHGMQGISLLNLNQKVCKLITYLAVALRGHMLTALGCGRCFICIYSRRK